MTRSSRPRSTQEAITARYDRIARVYDLVNAPMELFGLARRRRRLLGRASGTTLEVGVGTGRNLTLYPPGVELTGIDVSEQMLARARRVVERSGTSARLKLADVQHLPFDDDSFDTVTATCVFCSVANPTEGLREVARVARPGGQVLLLEHVRPRNPVLGWLADRIAPFVSRVMGPEINRRTEDNIAAAGLDTIEVRRCGVWREILACPIRTHDRASAG